MLYLSLLAGCLSLDLAESWQLDRLRILAVQAEPAEPQPGELVSFQSLVYLPPDLTLEGVVWFACLPEGADEFGCSLDESVLDSLDPEDPDLEALAEAGFIGFEPFLPPTWVAPADALEGLDDIAAQEGVSALINLSALPADAEDDGDVELAYKRLPISQALTPNHNPAVTSLLVDGEPLSDGVLVTSQSSTHALEPVLSVESIEVYTYTAIDGAQEERTEEPYFTWYTEGGTFDQTFSLHPYSDVEWTAPAEPFEGTVVVTVRDRRGGMAWASLRVIVE
ncbi:MAG: hypothetical protein ACI8S6_003550 [Myxococcota bacterium]|jgi:hypothetical protein